MPTEARDAGYRKPRDLETTQSPLRIFFRSGDLSMSGFYMWAAIAALGFLAAVTLISRPEQMPTNVYVLTICLVAGALFTAVRRFEPNRLVAFVLLRDRRSGSCETIGSLAVTPHPEMGRERLNMAPGG